MSPVGGFTRVDQPHQGRLRGFVNHPFRPRSVSRLEDWFRDMVRADLPDVLAQGQFNLPAVFGLWTARTMCRLAGLPLETAIDLRDAVRHVQRRAPFHIDAWVVLPDHMHALWTLPEDDTG